MELVLFALQSPQEDPHTPMLPMVLAEGTMMLSEAREVILGNLETGWSVETHGPLWNTVTWMLQMMWTSFDSPTFPHSWYHLYL